jgi:hypothetical protein
MRSTLRGGYGVHNVVTATDIKKLLHGEGMVCIRYKEQRRVRSCLGEDMVGIT